MFLSVSGPSVFVFWYIALHLYEIMLMFLILARSYCQCSGVLSRTGLNEFKLCPNSRYVGYIRNGTIKIWLDGLERTVSTMYARALYK